MIVIYFILLVIGSFFYILYDEPFSFYLICFLAALPVVLFIMVKICSKKVRVSFAGAQKVCVKDSRIPVVIRCENRGIIPVSDLIIEIEYFNAIDSKRDKVKISTPLFPKDVQFLTLHLRSQHYGTIRLVIKRCRVCDMLKLFKLKVRPFIKKGFYDETSFTVIPNVIPIENPIANYSEMGLETDEYSKDHKGDDPSEIFDIHEYQEGDKINRIHWKLSAKQDTTMVKDYSLPIANSIIMIVDMNIDKSRKDYMLLYDAAVETISSLTQYLTENSVAHKVIWYDTATDQNMTMTVKDEENARMLMSLLLRSGLHSDRHPALLNYVNTPDRFKCGHLLYFSAKYDSSVTAAMNDAELAFRYSYMLVGADESAERLYDEFADIVAINEVGAVESIRELCL